MTGWLLTQNKKSPDINKIKGTLADASIKHGYQWPERNPPRTAFSCGWTEVLYVQNKGNCDNGELFNIQGMAEASINCDFNLSSAPRILDKYQIHYNIFSENRENKVRMSPEVEVLGTGKEYDLISSNWDNKPDKKNSWHASGGDIVSFAVGMDNGTSYNAWSRGSIGSSISIELQNNAKSSFAGIFQELSGFDLKMDGNISNRPVYYARRNHEDFSLVKNVLEKEAQKLNLSSNSSKMVYNFLERLNLPFTPLNLDEKLLTESLKRYIEQFSYTFKGENEEQACYYLAWLRAEAAARPVNTSENITNTKVSFDNFIDKLTLVLNDNAKQAIGDADSSEIQKELSENLARVKGKLLYYYYELSVDTLFPAFKKPIDNNVETIILKKFENEKILFNLLNNQIKTEPANEFYKKWLSFYFDRVAERVVFWLVIESNKDEFRNPKYWGGLHYRARSIRNGLWPVEIYLTRIGEG